MEKNPKCTILKTRPDPLDLWFTLVLWEKAMVLQETMVNYNKL